MTIYKYGHTHANITTLFFTNAENTNGGETQKKAVQRKVVPPWEIQALNFLQK